MSVTYRGETFAGYNKPKRSTKGKKSHVVLIKDNGKDRMIRFGEKGASTAGKPILRQIQSNDLTNILIIVVRYFGGIKLGVTGLIRSYKTAAADSISQGIFVTKTIKEQYKVSFKYPLMNDVMRLIKEHNLEIINIDFQIDCNLIFAVPKSKDDNVVETFKKNHELKIKYLKTV